MSVLAATGPEHTSHADMVWIPRGVFWMGSDAHYREEAPQHRVEVDGFWVDRHPVTNGEFQNFVNQTGYVTLAEVAPDPADYPGALPEMLQAGSLVFVQPDRPVDLRVSTWWNFVFGADWRRPLGPDSSIEGLEEHPVVHIALQDAEAYARWAAKELPTEAEWEYAARGGLDRAQFAWGAELHPGGNYMANTWQGEFPWKNLAADGYEGTSPVDAFPANQYGLLDMIGNVWEWTADWFQDHHPAGQSPKPCCVPKNPRGGRKEMSYDPGLPLIKIPRKVIKGGSYLCAPNYCRRYRPAARSPQPIDSSSCNVGFRCVLRSLTDSQTL